MMAAAICCPRLKSVMRAPKAHPSHTREANSPISILVPEGAMEEALRQRE